MSFLSNLLIETKQELTQKTKMAVHRLPGRETESQLVKRVAQQTIFFHPDCFEVSLRIVH